MNDINVLLEPVHALLTQVGAFMPRLLIALGVLVVGWLFAKAFRFSVVKTLRLLNFNVLTERAGVDGFLQQGGTEKDTTDVVGWIAYAIALLVSLIIAFNSLGLTQVTDLLSKLLLFVPKGAGGPAGYRVRQLLRALRRHHGAGLLPCRRHHRRRTAGTRWRVTPILTFVLLLAIDHLDISGGLIQQTFLILLAGLVFAARWPSALAPATRRRRSSSAGSRKTVVTASHESRHDKLALVQPGQSLSGSRKGDRVDGARGESSRRPALVQGRHHLRTARQGLLRQQRRRHGRLPRPDREARLPAGPRRQHALAAAVLSLAPARRRLRHLRLPQRPSRLRHAAPTSASSSARPTGAACG